MCISISGISMSEVHAVFEAHLGSTWRQGKEEIGQWLCGETLLSKMLGEWRGHGNNFGPQ